MAAPLDVCWLGRVAYGDALALQHRLVEARAAGAIDDRLLLLEHDPVVTVGRGAGRGAAGQATVPVVEVERGGEATWHGPGQLVGYPILHLRPGERDLHRYLRGLEETLIRALAALGVLAGRRPPHTGVWVGDRKIASIGVAVRRWVTFHGFALNRAVDLAAFSGFQPCGLAPATMTSLDRLPGGPSDEVQLRDEVVRSFGEVFDRAPRPLDGPADLAPPAASR